MIICLHNKIPYANQLFFISIVMFQHLLKLLHTTTCTKAQLFPNYRGVTRRKRRIMAISGILFLLS